MEYIDPVEAAYHAARQGTYARSLVWVTARNRATGAAETMGLWTGDDHQEFVVGGQTRLYYAAGSVLDLEPLISQVGLDVHIHKVTINALTPEVSQLLRGYDTRLAPLEIHRAVFDLDSGALVAPPRRRFKGWVNTLTLNTPEEGGVGSADLLCASASRALTKSLALYRSDESMRRRAPNDRFREYTDISGEVGVWWGEVNAAVPAATSGGTASPTTRENPR